MKMDVGDGDGDGDDDYQQKSTYPNNYYPTHSN